MTKMMKKFNKKVINVLGRSSFLHFVFYSCSKHILFIHQTFINLTVNGSHMIFIVLSYIISSTNIQCISHMKLGTIDFIYQT